MSSSYSSSEITELEKTLSFIPQTINNSDDYLPEEIFIWNDLFEKVNQFKFDDTIRKYQKPNFISFLKSDHETTTKNAFYFNICLILNELLDPNYIFTSIPLSNKPGNPSITCHNNDLNLTILPIEIKIKFDLKGFEEQPLKEIYKLNEKARLIIKKIFLYMSENECQYGILTTYDHHWFLRRPLDNPKKLWISEALPLQSTSPPVLKTYAYVVYQLCKDFYSPHFLNVNNEPNNMIQTKNSFNDISNSNQNQNFCFKDFKFKKILGIGRSGKTLLCEFNEEMIALKCTDLWKSPPYILEEMQNEVEIYEILSDIQGEYIPKLVCYGYYEDGMCYVIGTTLVGTNLSNFKHITEQQKTRGLNALKAIHDKGILHSDIRNENILIDDNGVYLIDFGMSNYYDDDEENSESFQKFKEEEEQLISLLNEKIGQSDVVVEK
jgi:predicted Ser/Thr protein kinase